MVSRIWVALCLLGWCALIAAQGIGDGADAPADAPPELSPDAPTKGPWSWLSDRTQIHGFASQAAINTSANRFYGDSPNTSFDFTELGLNASVRLTNWLSISGQGLLRRAGDMYNGDPSLDYLLADVRLQSSAQRILGLRLGRVKSRLGLYNETRDVPFTHPGIFLPQTVYFDKTRNLLLSSDGAQVYADWFTAAGQLSLVASAGQAVLDENVEWAFMGADFDGRLESTAPLWTASFFYRDISERLTLGISSLAASLEFEPGRATPVGDGDIGVFYNIASLQYDAAKWTLTSELMLMPLHRRGFGVPILDLDNTVAGWYAQGTYRITPQVQLLGRFEQGRADQADANGSRQSALTGGLTPAYDFRSEIWTAGIRWDPTPNLMLRAEVQRHDGTFDLSIRENPDPSTSRKQWNLFGIEAALRF